MKLCAIFIVWDDYEILRYAIESISRQVEGIIVIASAESNKGEFSPIPEDFYENPYFDLFLKNPDLNKQPRENETEKRNFGLQKAREMGYTHFIMMDADESYEDFYEEKKRFDDPLLVGLVSNTVVYFRSPTLCFDDLTRVPFIHRLTIDLRFEKNYNYPFSVSDSYHPAIDPTRTMNITEGVQMSAVKMHHMSWIRRDIRKKIRNSAGQRINTFKEVIVNDYQNATEGYKIGIFSKQLRRVSNIFCLPEINDISLLTVQHD